MMTNTMTDSTIITNAAQSRFDLGDFDCCASISREGLDSFPENGRLWEMQGIGLWGKGWIGEARLALETASLFVSLQPLARVALASCYSRMGQDASVLVEYEFLARSENCPTAMLASVAARFGRVGAFALARDVCECIVRLRPDHHPAWFGIAFYTLRLGHDPRLAIEPLSMAFDLDPERLTDRINLACLHAAQDRLDRAWFLIQGVPPTAIHCLQTLQRLFPVIVQWGDSLLCGTYLETELASGSEQNVEPPAVER